MDPKHIQAALAVLYLQEHGDRLRLSKTVLIEAYRELLNYQIDVLPVEVIIYKRRNNG